MTRPTRYAAPTLDTPPVTDLSELSATDFDTESELLAAFECFDEGDTGVVKSDEMRKWLMDVGERLEARQVRTRCDVVVFERY